MTGFFGRYLKQLEWQISIGYPIRYYCPDCYWGSTSHGQHFCPFGCGVRQPIEHFIRELTLGI